MLSKLLSPNVCSRVHLQSAIYIPLLLYSNCKILFRYRNICLYALYDFRNSSKKRNFVKFYFMSRSAIFQVKFGENGASCCECYLIDYLSIFIIRPTNSYRVLCLLLVPVTYVITRSFKF